MATQLYISRPRPHSTEQQLVWLYVLSCHLLFGKTLSFMAGEAQEQGKLAGLVCAAFINALLRDPAHCENELRGVRNKQHRAPSMPRDDMERLRAS